MNRSLRQLRSLRMRRSAARVMKKPSRSLTRSPAEDTSSDWDREQQRLHQMNVAAVFGGEAAEDEDDDQETARRIR